MYKKSQNKKIGPSIDQRELLKIVKTWHITPGRSYRIFKCGNCRRVLRRAWHHWLDSAQFKTPVHLCKSCQKNLEISYPKAKVNLKRKDFLSPPKLKSTFLRITLRWNINSQVRLKKFNCDYCRRPVFKANHIHLRLNAKISEVHICRECWKNSFV